MNWDDGLNIFQNPHLGFSLENLRWMFTDTDYVRRYMPLGWVSYAVDRVLFGGGPLSYHWGNLLLHALNTCLVFELLGQLLALSRIRRAQSLWPAFVGALFWALHPLRTEPVSWASSRTYLVAAAFFFGAVLCYLRAAQTPDRTKRRLLISSALCFACSLLTYPIALGGLAVFVFLDMFLLGRLPTHWRDWPANGFRKVWLEKLLFLPAFALMLGANLWSRLNHPEIEPVVTFADFSLLSRALQAFWVWAWFLWKPWLPLELAPKYSHLLNDSLVTPAYWSAAVLIVGLSIFLWLKRGKWPGLWLVWLCHLALLGPFIGVTEHPHHTFDRYSYIAGVLWAVVLAAGVAMAWEKRKARVPMLSAALAACILWGVLANGQTAVWKDSASVQIAMADSIGQHPERAKHDVTAAVALLAMERAPEAESRIQIALRWKPQMPEAWGALGDALTEQGRTNDAISSYQRAVDLDPGLASARQNLAVALAMAGKHEEAVLEFEKILQQAPANATAHHNLAVSLHRLGRVEEAKQHLAEARRLQASKPTNRAG